MPIQNGFWTQKVSTSFKRGYPGKTFNLSSYCQGCPLGTRTARQLVTSDVLESGRGWVEVPIRLATGKHLAAGAPLGRYRQRGPGQLVAMFK